MNSILVLFGSKCRNTDSWKYDLQELHVTLHVKMTMPDSLCYPKNLWLSKVVEIILIHL